MLAARLQNWPIVGFPTSDSDSRGLDGDSDVDLMHANLVTHFSVRLFWIRGGAGPAYAHLCRRLGFWPRGAQTRLMQQSLQS